MVTISVSESILSNLAGEQRRVLSAWRAQIYLRRDSFRLSPGQRRWKNIPTSESDIQRHLRQMMDRQELKRIRGVAMTYVVTVPFSSRLPLDEREVLVEAHAYTILSYYSALEFHGLTYDQPKVITAFSAAKMQRDFIPLDTEIDEWEGLSFPSKTMPGKVLSMPVTWRSLSPSRTFGIDTYRRQQLPYRVTSLERTLIDSLQEPSLSGGILNVLRAWVIGYDRVDLPTLVRYTEMYGIALLKQRVGFVLEELGLHHPMLDIWAAKSNRGGSSRLVGTAEFSTHYSERWNLSLNGPVHVLRESE